MSRIGQRPIIVPDNVTVTVDGKYISAKGKFGELTWELPSNCVSVNCEGRVVNVSRSGDDRSARALHGLSRALIANMISGVNCRFEKRLELQGVGYQAFLAAGSVKLNVGFSHPVVLPIPPGIECALSDSTHIAVSGADKAAVGQFAAVIRSVRPPEPYKGKGIRYNNEYVKRKSGKAFGSK